MSICGHLWIVPLTVSHVVGRPSGNHLPLTTATNRFCGHLWIVPSPQACVTMTETHPQREDEHQDMQELRDRLQALRERISHVMVRL